MMAAGSLGRRQEFTTRRRETGSPVGMGESDPTLTAFMFEMLADQVTDPFLGSVLVVQMEPLREIEG